MSRDWISENETTMRLKITRQALGFWRERGVLALGRTIKTKPDVDGSILFWKRDVRKIERNIRDYAPFVDDKGRTWLPIHTVEDRFPYIAKNVDKWKRRHCPYLSENRKLLPQRFLCRAGGHQGISRRLFWLEDDLLEIEQNRKLVVDPESKPVTKRDTVSCPEAIELGFTDYLFWELAKKYGEKELRTVSRGDLTFGREVTTVPLAELKKARQKTDSKKVPVMTVHEASRFTKGAFSMSRMQYWEEVGCPFRGGEPLTVVKRDAVVPARFKGKDTARFLPDAKHYIRSEIEEAWSEFKRLAKWKGIHIDQNGDTWLTTGAAYQRYKVRDQALKHWNKNGWLDREQHERRGSGRYKTVWYYRELGQHGIADLIKLQQPSNGHIIMPALGASESNGESPNVCEPKSTPAQVSHEISSEGRIANLEQLADELALSGLQYDVLDTLFERKAFSPAFRVSTAELSQHMKRNCKTISKAVSRLKKLRLINTSLGRDGGNWLTAMGKELVEKNRQ